MPRKPPDVQWREERQQFQVRFSLKGRRWAKMLGPDRDVATDRALAFWLDVKNGRIQPEPDLPPDASFKKLYALFLASISTEVTERTLDTYTMYGRHFGTRLHTLADLTQGNLGNYIRARLGEVKRETVKKERATMGRFLQWLEEQGYIRETPKLPALRRGALGKAYGKRRRGAATVVSPDEIARIIAALPEWSASKRVDRFPIRARFLVLWETGLRPTTIDHLEVGKHFRRGADSLTLTDDIDKNRWGRSVPLSLAAREALDAVCPPRGSIFGEHDFRERLKAAAASVLDEARAATFCEYDIRHARATYLASHHGENLTGVALLMGWKRPTTLARYAHAQEGDARRIVDTATTRAATGDSATPDPDGGSVAVPGIFSQCEEEDSNLHGNYPTSTSSGTSNAQAQQYSGRTQKGRPYRALRIHGTATRWQAGNRAYRDFAPPSFRVAAGAVRFGVIALGAR